jgi:flavodoxin
MKVKVVYHSETGSTKKVAEAIAAAVGVSAEKAGESLINEKIDVLFIGAAVYATYQGFHPSIKKLVAAAQAADVRRVALFGTYAFRSSMDKLMALAKGAGLPVAEESFICKGKFLFFNFRHPNKADLQKATDFAKKLTAGAGRSGQ